MNWDDEQFVKLYTRDTVEWLLFPWQARAVWPLILRKVDRAGVMDLGSHERSEAVAAMIGLPVEVVRPGLDALIEKKSCIVNNGSLVCSNYIEAQSAKQSDKARQIKSRQTRRDIAKLSQNVTNCHTVSHGVTTRLDQTRLKKEIKKKKSETDLPDPSDPISVVFKFWQEHLGHTGCKFDRKRQTILRRALKDFPVDDCLDVVRGCKISEWHYKKYDGIQTIFRDVETIEKHRDRWRNRGSNGTDERLKKLQRALKDAETAMVVAEQCGTQQELARKKKAYYDAEENLRMYQGGK